LGAKSRRCSPGTGLNGSSFDVLATLRRSGAPYSLSPGDLLETYDGEFRNL